MFAEGGTLPSRFDPLAWHIHEMLFGFAMAAIAGFLLTAIPNWTGRPPVAGVGLALLAGLWALGRIACLLSAPLPAWCAIVVDVSFPIVLAGVVAREIVAGRNWRNLAMIAPLVILGAASLALAQAGQCAALGLAEQRRFRAGQDEREARREVGPRFRTDLRLFEIGQWRVAVIEQGLREELDFARRRGEAARRAACVRRGCLAWRVCNRTRTPPGAPRSCSSVIPVGASWWR